jgi:hypothetical protein
MPQRFRCPRACHPRRVGHRQHKELWFRGQGEKYEKSILRPALYRPQKVTNTMKEPSELLEIESLGESEKPLLVLRRRGAVIL